MSDLLKIIKDCKDGKKRAQEELYRLFAPMLFGVCLQFSNDKTEAEDNLQEGFIKIFQHIGEFNNKGSFKGWMRRIMVNNAIEKFRKKNRLFAVEQLENSNAFIAYEDIEARIAADDLMKMINELPVQYKVVFNLYAIEGYSHKEIGQMLGIADGTSKSNLSRARAILQKKLIERMKINRNEEIA